MGEIKKGAILSYLTIAINILLGLIYTPWILKTLGSSNYGLYTLATSLIMMFLMDFGMSGAITRFISNYRAENDTDGVNGFVKISVVFYALICFLGLIILTVIYFNIETIYSNLTTQEIFVFKKIYIIVAISIVSCFPVNICNGVLNAFEKYVLLKGVDIINKVGTAIATVIALCLGGGVISLVVVHGLFNILAFFVKIIAVLTATPVRVRDVIKVKSKTRFNELFSFTSWSTINSLAQRMIFNIVPSVLAMVTNTKVITIYGFANVIEGYVYNITQAITGLFMPKVSRTLVGQKDVKKILPLMTKVGRVNQSVISLLLIGLSVLGYEFVNLWVGKEYAVLYPCILLLSMPYFISASQQIANTCILVLNKIKYLTLINLFTGILNIIGIYIFAPKYGVMGVCAVTGAIFATRIIMNNIVYKGLLKIDIWKFFKDCQLKLLPAILLSTILSYIAVYISSLLFNGGWIFFGVKVSIVTLIYFVVMWLIGWNPNEKKMVFSFKRIL